MDVKIHKVVTDAASASSDLQDVALSVALNYHVLPEKANLVYQTIGVEFKERMIDPAIQEVMKAVSALYTAEELDYQKTRSKCGNARISYQTTAGIQYSRGRIFDCLI